jgi:serralysin
MLMFDRLLSATVPQAAPLPTYTLDQVISNFLRWDARWGPTTIAYSFYTARPAHQSGEPAYNGFRAFTAAQQAATTLAFDLIADIVNLNFVPVADNQQPVGPTNQRITFAASTTFPAFATAWADPLISAGYPLPGQHQIYSSETLFNTNRWGNNFSMGSRDFSVLMHEILHGLGLPHPGEYNRNANEEITYLQHAEYAQDTGQYTVMSYFGAHDGGADHQGRLASTPLLHDIAAMQALYGANLATRTGDTTYGFNSNAGRVAFDFSFNTMPVVSIWDAGGEDTLDCSGFFASQTIDLRPGAFSDVGYQTRNVSIAFGCDIENAVGGTWADEITGNALENRLEGREGADILFGGAGDDHLLGGLGDDTFHGEAGWDHIDGGAGEDTVVYLGAAGEHSIRYENGVVLVKGPEDKDTLSNVEFIRFSDKTVAVGEIICWFDPPAEGAGKDGAQVLPGLPEVSVVLPGLDAASPTKAARFVVTEEAWLL